LKRILNLLLIHPSTQQQQHNILSQASWGRLEMKPKRPKSHSSGTLIASLQALLSKATSLEIFQSLRSLLIDSSEVSLDLPLPLFTLSTRFRTPLRTGASGGLRWSCPNHLNRYLVSFYSIGATPTLSRITSFRTLSLLVYPQNYRNICISATLICWTRHLFLGQYSAPYSIAGRIAVL